MNKTIPKNTYIWAHVAVIIYHVITAILLILSQYMKLYISSKNLVVILASLLLITSLLATVPIAKKYNKITIE